MRVDIPTLTAYNNSFPTCFIWVLNVAPYSEGENITLPESTLIVIFRAIKYGVMLPSYVQSFLLTTRHDFSSEYDVHVFEYSLKFFPIRICIKYSSY
jgi:hypothetical protein